MNCYYIQTRNIADSTWSRLEEENNEWTSFEYLVDALEEADRIRANWPNDGFQQRRGVRVVDADGKIYDYS